MNEKKTNWLIVCHSKTKLQILDFVKFKDTLNADRVDIAETQQLLKEVLKNMKMVFLH